MGGNDQDQHVTLSVHPSTDVVQRKLQSGYRSQRVRLQVMLIVDQQQSALLRTIAFADHLGRKRDLPGEYLLFTHARKADHVYAAVPRPGRHRSDGRIDARGLTHEQALCFVFAPCVSV